ncbi:MAG: PQQ-dependent sugar dehydrogenase [Acidobacteriota bacterium]
MIPSFSERSGRPIRAVLEAVCIAAILAAGPVLAARPDCTGIGPVDTEALELVTVAVTPQGRPLFWTQAPGDPDRFYIVDQDGIIWLWKRGSAPADVTVFLDIRSQVITVSDEMGLLGLAFPPDFQQTGEFYVDYTGLAPQIATVIARYTIQPGDPDLADPASEDRVATFLQPDTNHNGGQIWFGDDGFLYVALGDGGGVGDQHGECGNGQDETNVLGSLIRIDVLGTDPSALPSECVDGGSGYMVPSDNPFVGMPGACDELWQIGLRNPWRSAIDAVTGDLYVADVGQLCWEEVNFVRAPDVAGRNFGWRQMEGNHCYQIGDDTCDPPGVSCGNEPDCFDPSLTLPVLEYPHDAGDCSITGGPVYRGCRLPRLDGAYFYGDYCNAWIRSLRIDAAGQATDQRDWTSELYPSAPPPPFSLTSFGEDLRGELYVVSREGEISKVVPEMHAIEVSPPATDQFFLLKPDAWVWEDIERVHLRPVDHYRVWRAFRPTDPFVCVGTSTVPQYPGDGYEPPRGEGAFYVVTAVDPAGVESSAGVNDGGPLTFDPAPCP